ncbi:uncharacterized protein LOC9648575 isoform X2 [Selaginella moellendorffii]|uniref:uncharacterized protein LOC9648575 isoform X2 n=1 Tax=Selaginella moellendorffii TaxID=88036 RepID=UPI000D1C43B5|nr:uncharacterized protein LOC9648575 isoform X2 [Selaginella moellendorffii]|eukprot:XP_024545767.1 uncharacterized protein LOC9648575 isoform X2 [Selaginella moellendorffii]
MERPEIHGVISQEWSSAMRISLGASSNAAAMLQVLRKILVLELLFLRFPALQHRFSRWSAMAVGNGSLISDFHTEASKTGHGSVEVAHRRILFAAGGTGGHVYPAISIAQAIQELQPSVEIEFVGTKDRMEWRAVPRAGYIIRDIPATGLKRPVLSPENFWLPFKLLVSIIACWRILSKFKPDVVVGTGGYVSGPLCLAAALRRIPLVLQEQNSQPGLTNKILGRFARVVFVAFAGAAAHFSRDRCLVSGNPTRLGFNRYVSSLVARRLFFPEDESCATKKEVVLVLGGSLGAKSVNMALSSFVLESLGRNCRRYIIWQTGSQYYKQVLESVGSGHSRLAIHGFIESMETAYAAADLVVARAGAITCSEILVAGKPSILIPSPNVTDDHQTKNARSLEEAGVARVLADSSLQSSPRILADAIDELLGDRQRLDKMAMKALDLAIPDAAARIAQRILDIVNTNS